MSEHSLSRLPKCFEIEFAFARFDFPIPLAHFVPLSVPGFTSSFAVPTYPNVATGLFYIRRRRVRNTFCSGFSAPERETEVTQVDGKTDRGEGGCAKLRKRRTFEKRSFPRG